jgi:unsaturated chondroitin disaccharide hydrolase
MITINTELKPSQFSGKLKKFWELSGQKIKLIEKDYDESKGSPVFTINGKYTTRGWTEWTQRYQHGAPLLQKDFTGEISYLE